MARVGDDLVFRILVALEGLFDIGGRDGIVVGAFQQQDRPGIAGEPLVGIQIAKLRIEPLAQRRAEQVGRILDLAGLRVGLCPHVHDVEGGGEQDQSGDVAADLLCGQGGDQSAEAVSGDIDPAAVGKGLFPDAGDDAEQVFFLGVHGHLQGRAPGAARAQGTALEIKGIGIEAP